MRMGAGSRSFGLVLAALLVASVVAAGAPARAEAPPAPSPENARQARELYKKGVAHYDLNEYGAALDDFRDAYRVVQDAVLLFNIAQCYRKLGQNGEALSFYRNYLRR